MLPIYSAFTSDINSLPRLACNFLPERKRACLWVRFTDLWEQRATRMLLMATGFWFFQPFVSSFKKWGVNRCLGLSAVHDQFFFLSFHPLKCELSVLLFINLSLFSQDLKTNSLIWKRKSCSFLGLGDSFSASPSQAHSVSISGPFNECASYVFGCESA